MLIDFTALRMGNPSWQHEHVCMHHHKKVNPSEWSEDGESLVVCIEEGESLGPTSVCVCASSEKGESFGVIQEWRIPRCVCASPKEEDSFVVIRWWGIPHFLCASHAEGETFGVTWGWGISRCVYASVTSNPWSCTRNFRNIKNEIYLIRCVTLCVRFPKSPIWPNLSYVVRDTDVWSHRGILVFWPL